MKYLELGLFAAKTGNLKPANFPDEMFDLLSIPAYDRGQPEIIRGSDIGSSKQMVAPGDVMISKIVPHIRRVWIVPQNNGRRQIASGEWIVFRHSDFHGPWLRHVLLSESFHHRFMQTVAGVGGSLLRARPAYVFKINIQIPELDEQRRIADILDQADVLRAKRHETIAHLDALSHSIFYEMFGDPLENPRGWHCMRLGELGAWQSGGTPARAEATFYGVGHWWYTSGELESKWLGRTTEQITTEGLNGSAAKLIPPGALLLGMYDTAALKSGIATRVVTCNQAIAFAQLDKRKVEVEFVYEAIQIGRERYRSLQRGVRQKNLNLSIIRELEIPVPPLGLQQEFARRVASVENLKSKHRAQLAELDNLFLSLQDRAFKGEL